MLDLYVEFEQIIEQLNQRGLEYALCGGLALAVYAAPRATVDIDLLVERASLDQIKAELRLLGYTIEAIPMKFAGAEIHRLSKPDSDGDVLSVDLLLVLPENEQAWREKATVQWEKNQLSIVSPSGLILLKSFRNSEQDQIDVRNLRDANPELR